MATKPLHILFVCTANRLRSPTAEAVFSCRPGLKVSSAGLDRGSARVLDAAAIEDADVIFVMEQHHRNTLRKRFRRSIGARPVIVLGIPDDYERDQPELVELLIERVSPHLPP